jgi:K+-sensing histidine kinase KdpD
MAGAACGGGIGENPAPRGQVIDLSRIFAQTIGPGVFNYPRLTRIVFKEQKAPAICQAERTSIVTAEGEMRVLKSLLPIAASLGLMSAVTAILWHINSNSAGAHSLVYIYLFPVAVVAGLHGGGLALLCTAVALVCADYFLQEPIYSFTNDNPVEYGDLICFTVLAVTAVKVIRELARPKGASRSAARPA